MVADFRELRVYQAAFGAAMKIFTLSKTWAKEERYSLIDQIRRSSRSVCGNIGEGWRKRRYPGSFVQCLSHADAKECGYLTQEAWQELRESYNHICAQLVTMINQADKWCKTEN